MIVKAAHYPLGKENAAFKDVPNGHWATRYIEAAQRQERSKDTRQPNLCRTTS
ncbi:hypothetical protein CULT_1600002 [[Clostridium] ultunense Esp]|nr:hypothetical protein CULT_1600002 [[Clostridium] ultunense Esp]